MTMEQVPEPVISNIPAKKHVAKPDDTTYHKVILVYH